MLTHTRGLFERLPDSSGGRETVEAGKAEAHLATFREFCRCALMVLLAGGILAGIIALEASIYLPRIAWKASSAYGDGHSGQ
jgi:hypothetical protein